MAGQNGVLRDHYKIIQFIGYGHHGKVYRAKEKGKEKFVAVKRERKREKCRCEESALFREYKKLKLLRHDSDARRDSLERHESRNSDERQNSGETYNPDESLEQGVSGIPQVFWYGKDRKDRRCMAMELLGPDLDTLLRRCGGKFSLKTVLKLIDQMIKRAEYIHTRGILHCSIKPSNFTIGTGENKHVLYLIDFGSSKYFEECDFIYRLCGPLCSINAHHSGKLGPKDDMISIGYMAVKFLKGKLPWSRYKCNRKSKVATHNSELTSGLPSEFCEYMDYCNSVEGRPDYGKMRKMFHKLFTQITIQDNKFKWDWQIAEEPLEITKEPQEIAKEPQEIAKEPQEIAKEPQEIANEPKEIAKEIAEEPQEIAKEPQEIAEEPQEITKEPQEIAKELQEIAKELQEIAKEPQEIANEPKEITKEPQEIAKDSFSNPLEEIDDAYRKIQKKVLGTLESREICRLEHVEASDQTRKRKLPKDFDKF